MLRYILRRFGSALPTLFIVITLSFFMMRAVPGGPFDAERALPPQIEENLKRVYGLDKPIWEQYADYVGGVLTGDFGPSFSYHDFTVTEILAEGIPASLRLGGSALLLAMLVGMTIGTFAAWRQNSRADHAVMAFAMIGIAIPNYVVAPVLTLIFGVWLHWLPVAGWNDGAIQNLILPVTALALPQIAYISRLSRGSMVEAFHANHVRTARAKGLRERLVIIRHAMRGGLIPVISYLGPAAAYVLTGSVVIETIFDLPGIGRHFILGAINRDYTLVMGVVVVFAALIVLLNLLVDLIYALIDPKVRLD